MEFDDLREHVHFADAHGQISADDREYLVAEGLLGLEDDDGDDFDDPEDAGPDYWAESLLELAFSGCRQSEPAREAFSIAELTEKVLPVWDEAARRAARKQIHAGCSPREAAFRFLRAADRRPHRRGRRRHAHSRRMLRARARSPGRPARPTYDAAPCGSAGAAS